MHPIPIVIVNYKDYARRYLADCVRSLRAVSDTPWTLYVVDNATSEETRAYIASVAPEAEIIPVEENAGYAVYTRIAERLSAAGERLMLIMNMDVEVQPDFLGPLAAVIDSAPDIAAVQSRIMLHGSDGVVNSAGNALHLLGFGYSVGGYRRWEEMRGSFPGHPEVAYPSGACMLVRLDVVQQIGLFDRDFFMYHEDLDFGWKALIAGYRCVLVPESVISHKYEAERSARQYYWMERNRFVCVFKNYRLPTLALLLPLLAAAEIGLLMFAVVRGFWREKLRVYGEWCTAWYWRRIAAGRAHIRSIRRRGDHRVLARVSGAIRARQLDTPAVRLVLNPVCTVYLALLRLVVLW